MVQSEYLGSVYYEKEFKKESLRCIKDSFIYHWRYGHHPDFGKDSLFHKPPCVYPIHLRKVHVNIGLYTNAYGISGTEECWSDWATGRFNANGYEKKIPTSDSYLIYAVCENRNAGLLDFWFPPAHKNAEFESSVQDMVELADAFYEKISGKPMGRDQEIWHPDYLVKRPA
ncbi:type II toxin-antitoxin system YafO family toxin [Klebsiella pneumoniae]|uniref:type II toxin-antitoxin system YafO family toxin n=1 Tax=Klebsiella pneumoniae complex TaxID=3390273 RepID=UPI000F18F892|nr:MULTISPECIES: type II toxin-antitoxin system YafO family toxin [Klebsiella]MBZ7035614.1 toxin YafO, type II toxin-antitoxin system family protein [Klebsiella variicola]VCW25863.1 hypothetical protein BANRA_03495 [Klebsiella variicola]